ncbi:MAG TPA: hypothetical protein DC053_09555 [Lachnoclostridium sp.]|nr:hypothetical protein [Lachnoclostridium sp.]
MPRSCTQGTPLCFSHAR